MTSSRDLYSRIFGTKIKYCVLDLDGVLCDWVRGAMHLHDIRMTLEEFYAGHKGTPYVQDILQMPAAAFWEPMNEEFWANLEWMPDGREILSMCEERFGREHITIGTSPSYNPGCWDGKRRWIERHMPSYYHRTEAQMFGSRKWMMANSETILVDDFDSNIKKFEDTRGGHVCPVPRLWNSLHPLADRAIEIVREVLFVKKKAAA